MVVDTEALYGKPTLFTSSHLKCCGGPTNEAKRQAEADEFMAFHRDAMEPGGDLTLPEGSPFIFGGDLNMVGLGDPIVTLQTGNIYDEATYGEDFAPDWDGTGMLELPILQADRPMDYTWRNDNSDYAPGKLDYAIVSDGVVQVLRSTDFKPKTCPASASATTGCWPPTRGSRRTTCPSWWTWP